MKTFYSFIVALLLAGPFAGTLSAQDITGTWQGTINGKGVRTLVRIFRQLDGSLQLRLLPVDQQNADWGTGNLATTVSLDGTDFKFTIDGLKINFEGKLSPDGNSITGTLAQVNVPYNLSRATKETEWRDPAPHVDQFITVDKNVRLEVIDFGGSGQPLVMLAGLGNTAHVFDRIAPKLVDQFHVYAITRRGHGASSMPASGYNADRLADDVLEVVAALKLTRPIVAGHSVAGEELSSIGSRYPDRVAGLMYLDAGYSYAIHDPLCTTPRIPPPSADKPTSVGAAIQRGTQQYTTIKAPVLLVYAAPKEGEPANDASVAREGCAKAFQAHVPSARIVRLPGAGHFVFATNEADVLKEIRDFTSGLKR